MHEWNEPKNGIHKIYLQENTGDGVLFSAVADMWAYSFSKMDFITDAFFMKIVKFYRTSFLQNNAARLPLISCTFSMYQLLYHW